MKTSSLITNRHLAIAGTALLCCFGGGSLHADSQRTQFLADQPWPDDKGVLINAHGGGIMLYRGVYHWFGESYANPALHTPQATGVHCYSSTDLYNWKDQGVVLARSNDPASEIGEGSIIERPKVIYNAMTRKFVMWFHLELKGRGYNAAHSGVAVADQPAGPYTFLRSERPDAGTWPLNASADEKAGRGDASLMAQDFAGGQMARDMTLFVDDDGKAYHIFASEDNSTMHISQLSDSYLSHSGKWVRALVGLGREAPALCKYKGRYWLVTSGQSSWDPNTAGIAAADSIWGPWKELGNPCADGTLPRNVVRPTVAQWKQLGQPSVGGNGRYNLGFEHTFGGQSTFILPVHGQPGAFIAMFDIWRPGNQTTSGYVWLPVVFGNNDNGFTIPWRDPWNLSFFNGSKQ